MSNISSRTSPDNYFENFEIGQVIAHARGKTVTEMDNVLLTNMVMNTAQGHFNEHLMKQSSDIPVSTPASCSVASIFPW